MAGTLLVAAQLLQLLPAGAQELGTISTCPAAPVIAAASSTYALSNETGLNARQASALVTAIMNQLTLSAPEFATPSTVASMNAIQSTVLAAASKGLAPTESLGHDQIAELPPEQALLTGDGYRKMTKAIVQGAVQGAMTMGMGADGLRDLVTAVTTAMVVDAAKQAAATAIRKDNGTLTPGNALPMDNAEAGKDVTATVVSTIVLVAKAAGFSDKQVSDAVNRAGDECTKIAQNIDQVLTPEALGSVTAGATASGPANDVASGVAGQVAGQVASQVASQVATQVATQVAKQVAAQVATAVAAEVKYQVDTKIAGSVIDQETSLPASQTMTPTGTLPPSTLPTAPGTPVIPGGNAPPTALSAPNPTPNPTPRNASPY